MPKKKLEGEGTYTGSTAYDREAEKFAKSGKVEPAAEEARRAMDTGEEQSLEQADAEAKEHAAEEDRLLRSNERSKEDPHPDHKGL